MSPTICFILQQKQSTSQHNKMLMSLKKSMAQKSQEDNTNSASKNRKAQNIQKKTRRETRYDGMTTDHNSFAFATKLTNSSKPLTVEEQREE